MKNLNLSFLKISSLFIVGVLVFVACSKETDESEVQAQEYKSYKSEAKSVFHAYNKLTENLKNSKGSPITNFELTQENIDNNLSEYGIKKGEVTKPTILEIVKNIGIADENGFDFFIQTTNYSNFTKRMLIKLSKKEVIENLEKEKEFIKLSPQEKELLLFSNNLIVEHINNIENSRIHCPSTDCGAAGLLIGAVSGFGICGPPCAIGGAIIGLILGTAGK